MNENLRAKGFADLARRYLAVIDTPPRDRVEFLTRIEVLLARLVASAHDLPQVEPTTSELNSQNVAPPAGLVDALGAADIYWDVLDPTSVRQTPEIAAGSLTDDLSDIYIDLKRGLQLWDSGNERDAVWEWRFGLHSHWGMHAVNALRVVHARLW